MSALPGDPPGGLRWRPSVYQAAVGLSGASAALGLAREVLVLGRLGLGGVNDQLQFALSITYTVALLGEPLRLASLNLLGRRVGGRLTAGVLAVIAVAAVVTTLVFQTSARSLPVRWLLVAGAAGAANLVLMAVLPRRQAAGPFLPVHAVTVMPNVLMVAILLFPAPSDEVFASRVVHLFLLAPLVQLIALLILAPSGDEGVLAPAPRRWDELPPVGWHAVGAVGGQATQWFLRSTLLAAPAGTLSAFVLVLRATETIRAVFIDSYIASRVRRWARGDRSTSTVVDARWLSPPALAAVTVVALLVALGWQGRTDTLVSAATIMLVAGSYFVLVLRVRYQSLNTKAQPLREVRRIAALELGSAGVVGVLASLAAPLALLPWAAYVAKPAAALALLPPAESAAPSIMPES